MATKAELQSYHSAAYLSFLESHNDCKDHDDIDNSTELESLGLGELYFKISTRGEEGEGKVTVSRSKGGGEGEGQAYVAECK